MGGDVLETLAGDPEAKKFGKMKEYFTDPAEGECVPALRFVPSFVFFIVVVYACLSLLKSAHSSLRHFFRLFGRRVTCLSLRFFAL